MSKCIKCGMEIESVIDLSKPDEFGRPFTIIGYKCNVCNLQWTPAEHKDNQNWAVRHIHALETQVKILEEAILELQKKVLK